MPEVRRIELAEQQTLGDAIKSVREAVLPEQIANDELAAWVISHDATLRTDESPHFPPSLGERDPESSAAYLFAVAASSIFRQKIPLYFGAMFHIGRVWTVSTTALREIGQLEEPRQMKRFVADLSAQVRRSLKFPRRRGRLNPSSLQQSIAEACGEARGLHEHRIADARAWWQIWQDEVRPFRDQYDRLQRYYNEAAYGRAGRDGSRQFKRVALETLALGWQPSALIDALERDGVRFKHPEQPAETMPFGTDPAWLGLILAAVSEDEPFFWHHFGHDWLRALIDRNEIERKQLVTAKVNTAIDLLRERHGNTDPFAAFDFGAGPASELLDALYRQHQLPDGSESPWLQQWRARLRDLPYYGTVPLDWQAHLDDFTRTADAVIKLGICGGGHLRHMGTPWPEFVQKMFENRWIARVATLLLSPGGGGETMGPERFTSLVSAVVERLNALGYELKAPPVPRIRNLFMHIQKDESVIEGGW
ncbi:MAG: hypothetical protein JOY71_03295 [Acetobacteraceae bacterium]|nr:hypothetical protein [Acetobacteraceae bacterium]